MRAGLVGYSQTGKTTLFNALTGQRAQTGGGSRAKSNLGVIKVPDDRLRRLTEIYRPRRTVPAEIVFVDVPGPRTKGSGLDAATLQSLREVEALAVVLRNFEGSSGSAPDCVRELGDFEAELILNDLVVVERRLERLVKERGSEREKAVLERCRQALDGGQSLRLVELSADEEHEISSFAFLSRRPLLAVLNTSEADLGRGMPESLVHAADERRIQVMDVCASLESEIAALGDDERAEFLSSMGIDEPASARFIRAAYALLDYLSFFTVGEDEVRAWTVRAGSKAPRAAGRVHSDMERGFIRAEVMAYEDFVGVGNEAKMREMGKLRVEGKDYVVADGDILNFRFAV